MNTKNKYINVNTSINWEKKRKPVGSIACMSKIAASVLLKLFANGYENLKLLAIPKLVENYTLSFHLNDVCLDKP